MVWKCIRFLVACSRARTLRFPFSQPPTPLAPSPRPSSNTNATRMHVWRVMLTGWDLGQWPNATDSHIKWPKLIMFNVYTDNGFRGRQPSSTAAIICLFKHLLFSLLLFLSFEFVYLMRTRPPSQCLTPITIRRTIPAPRPFRSFSSSNFNFRSCHRLDFHWRAAARAPRRSPINCISRKKYFSGTKPPSARNFVDLFSPLLFRSHIFPSSRTKWILSLRANASSANSSSINRVWFASVYSFRLKWAKMSVVYCYSIQWTVRRRLFAAA